MGGSRQYPSFYMPEGSAGEPQVLGGILWLLVSIGLLTGLIKTPSFCLGFLGIAGIGVGMYLMSTVNSRDKLAARHWLEYACQAQVPILKRRYDPADDMGAYYLPSRFYDGPYPESWHLELDMHLCYKESSSEQESLDVKISQQQYEAYAGKESVTIYYTPDKPEVLLLEDEMRFALGSS